MKELQGRVAVVTGAASGIGYAMAERLAGERMKIVLADVEDGALTAAAAGLKGKGAEVLPVRCDVAQAAEVDVLADKAYAAFGAVHVLCNNAGVAGDSSSTWEQTLENWQWVFGVNLWGVIHGLRSFLPRMLEGGDEGHIVNTASMAGHIAMPMLSAYHASKFAVVSITESLHFELQMRGAKVRASVLCPGFVRTRIMESDRNRPAALRTEPRMASEAEQAMRAAFASFVDNGIPASEVAERVLEAVREERFYVFPHPEMLGSVRSRMEKILAGENPTIELLPELQERMKI